VFEPLGTPTTMRVHGPGGDAYTTPVYPSPIYGLGLCRPSDPGRVAEWCVVHRGSGMVIGVARTGEDAMQMANALGFAASSAGVFWEHDLDTVTGNMLAMERCRSAVTPFLAR
jgi:hypothetical protein